MNKILVLVMSHKTDDEIFKTFKKIWDQKIESIKNKFLVDILFLYSDNNISEEFIVDGNELISKCEENYWQSLLTKTINGFNYFNKNDYDLVFKTNLSTLINFDKFCSYCNNLNCDDFIYEGSVGNYLGYEFCSGAGMLLNKKTVNIVLNNIDKIDNTWTDDIFIGFILNKLNNIKPNNNGLTRFDIISDTNLTDDIKNHTHIRIKIRENEKDIYYANKVFNLIYG